MAVAVGGAPRDCRAARGHQDRRVPGPEVRDDSAMLGIPDLQGRLVRWGGSGQDDAARDDTFGGEAIRNRDRRTRRFASNTDILDRVVPGRDGDRRNPRRVSSRTRVGVNRATYQDRSGLSVESGLVVGPHLSASSCPDHREQTGCVTRGPDGSHIRVGELDRTHRAPIQRLQQQRPRPVVDQTDHYPAGVNRRWLQRARQRPGRTGRRRRRA